MRQYIFFTFFFIAGFVPIYLFIGWIYIFNAYSDLSHLEKQEIFNETISFGLNSTGNFYIQLIVILFGLSAVVYFGFQLKRHKNKRIEKVIHNYTFCLVLLILFSIFTLHSIWAVL